METVVYWINLFLSSIDNILSERYSNLTLHSGKYELSNYSKILKPVQLFPCDGYMHLLSGSLVASRAHVLFLRSAKPYHEDLGVLKE